MLVTLSRVDGSSPATFQYNPSVSRDIEVQGGTLDMDGRKYPVGFAGENTHEVFSLEYLDGLDLPDGGQLDVLETLLDTYRGFPLMMQRAGDDTTSGSEPNIVIYVWLLRTSQRFEKKGRSVVTFSVERIDYEESSS